jgi:hypothetical protein
LVNINIEIPDELHKKIKIDALKKDSTLRDFIFSKLENYTKERDKAK